jgi:hypothetical protein
MFVLNPVGGARVAGKCVAGKWCNCNCRVCAILAPDLAPSNFSEVPGEHMGRALTALGIVALIGAFAWWQTFYGEVQRLLGGTGPLPIECIYSMSSACRMVANAAEVFGANSYHPVIFWTACGCLLVGLVMASRGRGAKPRSRSRIRSRPRL